ncbi:2-dehydropantoate 2-reductase [Aminivibrio sp.]
MKVAILGSGAMGSLFGGMLAEGGCDVTLIDIWKEHMDRINASGLSIEGVRGERVISSLRGVTDPKEVGEADLVIVFVKATATKAAMEGARSLLGPETAVLTLQNGLGNGEKLAEVIGGERVLAGITGHGCTLLGPGRIRHAGAGDTVLGELKGKITPRLKRIAAVLEESGFSVRTTENVSGLIWTKLLANVGINALTALTGLRNGQLLDYPETEELLRLAVHEAVAVAEGKGIRLEVEDPVEHCREIARRTASNRSSMLQDVTARRQTEIDVINGAIAEEGAALGIPAPVNRVLTNLVKVRQKTYGELE